MFDYYSHAGPGAAFLRPGGHPDFFGDPRPDAPELAYRGEYGVGVPTIVVNPGQIDIVNYVEGEDVPTYDRPLTVEIWYPAIIPEGVEAYTEYESMLGRPNIDETRPAIPFNWPGRALRDAEPDLSGGPYPLVIVAHGYPGNRYLLTYLTEIWPRRAMSCSRRITLTRLCRWRVRQHLLNRPLDILFMVDKAAELGRPARTPSWQVWSTPI